MLIWKNTTILNSHDEGLTFTDEKNKAIIVLMGSQSIDIEDFSIVKLGTYDAQKTDGRI